MTDDAAAYRRVPLELINQRNLDLVDELFADDYEEHADVPADFPRNREGVRMFFRALLQAFPDFQYEVLQQYQDGDMHIGYIRGTGTMEGEFMGMPPSGRSASWDEVHIGRVQDGKILEHWAVIDQLSMLQQLGFVPPPGG